MASPEDVQKLTLDPRFYQLPEHEQLQTLGQMIPQFTSMSPKDQKDMVGRYKLHYLQSPQYQSLGQNKGKGFWGQVADFPMKIGKDIMSASASVPEILADPVAAGEGMMHSVLGYDAAAKADEAAARGGPGGWTESMGYGAASKIPLFGPAAAKIAEDIAPEADYPTGREGGKAGEGLAGFTELIAPMGAKKLPERAGTLPKKLQVESHWNPVEQKAIESLAPDVDMSTGQQLGIEPLRRTETGLRNVPGSASRANKFYRRQQEQLATKGADLAAEVSPVSTGEAGAGRVVQSRIKERIVRLQNHADRMYDYVRGKTAQAQQSVQTGTQQSGVINPATNQPFTTPIMQAFEAPVDLAPIRQNLTRVYQDLKRLMPTAQKENSPAFGALEDLMTSGETHMNAMDFDKFLGSLKSVSREGTNPFLSDVSQSLARKVITEGENGLNRALLTAGPDVPAKLKIARNSVKAYYDSAEKLAELPQEPAQLFDRLSRGGDVVINQLGDLNKIAPNELKVVGRTYLQGLVEMAIKEGGFGRAQGVKASWERLGPETKELLFGKDLTTKLDDFMLGAKRLTGDLNPSGTMHQGAAYTAGAGAAFYVGRDFLMGLGTGDFHAFARSAIGSGVTITGANLLSRMFFNPATADLLTGVTKLPVRTPAFRTAVTALGEKILQEGANAAAESQRQRQQNVQQPPVTQPNPPQAAAPEPAVAAASTPDESVQEQ